MSRFFKTVLLALVIVGGLWVLFNQEQIQQAGGLSAYIAQNYGTSRSNAFQQSSWNQQSNWTAGPTRFQQTAGNWQAPNGFARQRTGSRPDLRRLSLHLLLFSLLVSACYRALVDRDYPIDPPIEFASRRSK